LDYAWEFGTFCGVKIWIGLIHFLWRTIFKGDGGGGDWNTKENFCMKILRQNEGYLEISFLMYVILHKGCWDLFFWFNFLNLRCRTCLLHFLLNTRKMQSFSLHFFTEYIKDAEPFASIFLLNTSKMLNFLLLFFDECR